MKATIISKGWGNIDLTRLKTPKILIGDPSWIFELLGWTKHNQKKK